MRKPQTTRISLLAALVAALALLGPLAGCGDDEAGTTSSTGTSTSATGADTAATAATGGESTATAQEPGGDGGSGPVAPPETVIEDFLVSDDTDEVCGSEISPELLRSTYGDISGCRNGRPAASLADTVTVKDLDVEGSSATAVAVPKGGSYDGARVTFELELDGNRWVITQVDAAIPVGP